MKIYKTDKNDPQRIPLKLHEDNEYEYLDTENPYKSHDDSTTSTVGKIEGDSSDTKSPIDTTAVRNQYWMDQSLGGGRAYSMMTTKKKLGESVDVLKFLTERDVLVMSSQEQEPDMDMDMGGEEEMGLEEDPNMEAEMGGEEEPEDPNITALVELLMQSADPQTIEAVLKYAQGVIESKGGDEEQMQAQDDTGMDDGMEEYPNLGMEEEDPNMAAQQQAESKQYNLDEFINDYLDDSSDKPKTPTVSKNLGSGGNPSLKSKMFNPLQKK